MKILFTSSNSPLSVIIRSITKEPVSHCAILCEDYVVQSNLLGIGIEDYTTLQKSATIVYELDIPDNYQRIFNLFAEYRNAPYDIGALLYLGLRYLIPQLPKANLWRQSGSFLCTEWVTEYLDGQVDSTISPYQLYLKLKEKLNE